MKKKIKKISIILLVILISIFVGYEHPGLVEVPKKYVYFLLKKVGLRESALDKTINKETIKNFNEDKIIEFKGNSFSVMLTKLKSYEGKSASLIINNNNELDYNLYTQDGLLIKKNEVSEINLPLFFHNDSKHSSGVKSVFSIKDEYFALISSKTFSCLSASLISLKNLKELIRSDCLPDTDEADFDALGGAYVKKK